MVSASPAHLDAVAFNLVDEAEFARLLRRRPSSLAEAVRTKRIFFVEDHGQRGYPSFFVDASYRRRDLYKVSRMLGALTGGSKLQFFAQPKASLGGITPLTALQRGMRTEVLRSAEGFAER
jgi:hypothetical protein